MYNANVLQIVSTNNCFVTVCRRNKVLARITVLSQVSLIVPPLRLEQFLGNSDTNSLKIRGGK